jgi:glycosyltransferase involved in cell wall biosynthesis
MFSNIPVVASASGGHLEAIRNGETGMLVTPDDANALAAAALDFLDNPAKARAMSSAAFAWAQRNFSPAMHATTVASIYRELLSA